MGAEKRIAALDTCALSFYQQGRAPNAAAEAVQVAAKIEYYMRGVQEGKGLVVLPAICLGEHLSQFNDAQRQSVREGIEENFIVIEYGVEAAMEFAKMRFDKVAFDAAKKNTGKPAQCVKVDCLIAALARGFNATEVLTDNSRDFATLSHGKLAVVEIDQLPNPPVPHPVIFDPNPPPETGE
jgi:hypothetical protein